MHLRDAHLLGDGLRMGETVGAVVAIDLKHAAAMAPVSLVPRADGSVAHFPHLLERAKPGLIAVTRFGKRFTNEADSYHDFMQGLLKALPGGEEVQAWLIVDHRFIRRWGLGAVKPAPVSFKGMLANGYLKQGHTLADLANQIKVPADKLQATVERFNAFADKGVDEDFQRGTTDYQRANGDATWHGPNPCLGALREGPFYAVALYPGDIGAATGLVTDGDARVLNAQGVAIDGLYAAGNDMHSIMGGVYPAPGITIGPGVTFGYLAAKHAVARARQL